MFNINGEYRIVVANGKITSVEPIEKKEMREYKYEELHRELNFNLSKEMKTLSEDVTLPKGISGCIALISVIDDPTARCELKWGKWW
jgi:hypothetical protein